MKIIRSLFTVTTLFLGISLHANIQQTQQPVKQKNKTLSAKIYASPAKRCPKNEKWSVENIAKWLGESPQRVVRAKQYKMLKNEDLCKMPSDKLAWVFKRIDNPKRPDKPDEAAAFRAMQQSVNGVLKPDGLINAIAQRKKILNNSASSQTTYGAGIQKHSWQSLGPGNIGGRVRTLWIHPSDTNILFSGSVGGGIWKSINGGTSWAPVNDFMGNLAISSIAADPRTTGNVNTTVLYAGTGEGIYNIDALRGYGIFKSTDGGKTWDHLDSTDPSGDNDWYYINRVAVSPTGTIMAAARDNAIFISKDDGASWTKKVISVAGTYNMRYQVCFDPNDSNNSIVTGDTGYIFHTTNEGSTWNSVQITATSGFSGRVEIAYAKSVPNLIYASVQKNSGEIYKSTDGGATWTYISNPQHLGNQGWYANTIWVDPSDENHLVIGGLDLYRSTDGGVNWTQISTWYYSPHSPHADHHFIVSDPTDNAKVYVANDGGIYRADDITTVTKNLNNNGWTNLNNDFAVTQFYGAAGQTGSNIVAGAQDNGDLFLQNDGTWKAVDGGDGGFSGVVPSTTAEEFFYFGEYVYLKMHRSDNGANAVDIYSDLDDANNNNANFIAPFTADPNNPDVVLGGGASLWRTTNAREADESSIVWSNIKDSTGSKISQITVADGNSDIIVVGHNNGEIYKTTNGTSGAPTWTKIHDSNGKMVLALKIDKDNHDVIYAGWGGYSAGNLNVSSDGGTTWDDISNGLPESPMRSIVRNPVNHSYLYVGTEVGVFTSEDGGTHWQTSNDGPANVSVDKLFWYNDTTLVAATHGRGIFQIKYVQPKGIAKNDFNGDGIADILFRDPSTGKNLIFFQNANGSRDSYTYTTRISDDWNGTAVADFNRDGIADILFRNPSTGKNLIFFMKPDGSRDSYAYVNRLTDEWDVAGTGDFDANGIADILFRNHINGKNLIYFMDDDGSRSSYAYVNKISLSWDIKGIDDFNNDGVDDILFRNNTNGENLIYFMNDDGSIASTAYATHISNSWKLAGTADFNGDGIADILFRNPSSGKNLIFFQNADGSRDSYTYTTSASSRWEAVNIADFNGDTVPDILFRDSSSGENLIFFLNKDGSRASYAYTSSIGSDWSVVR